MNVRSPFQPEDLHELDERLLSKADYVVSMAAIAQGPNIPGKGVIGLRHDVDNLLVPAVQMAEWEAERGYESTYFILHTAPYWQEKKLLRESLDRIADLGHEIGFHVNAIAEAVRTGRDPASIVIDALDELRGYGHYIGGVVAHGDPACYDAAGQVRFVNDEVFTESARPQYGPPDRIIDGIHLRPISRLELGLTYDPNWLPRAAYLSDSGGRWSLPFDEVADEYSLLDGQLHLLQHPCWWSEAFVPSEVAA